jgi:hypothetical protein
MLALVMLSAAAVTIYRFGGLSLASWQFPYPLDYGEGVVLDVSSRLSKFENIYPSDLRPPPWFIANYPPVYYLLRAAALWVGGPSLWSGRLICQFSAIVTAILIGLVLHRLTRDRTASLVASLTFLTIPFVVIWSQFDRVDMPGMLLSWLGLWSITSAWRHRVAFAGVCFIASSYTRQTAAVAALAAAVIWLVHQRQSRHASILAASVVAGGVALGISLNLATSGGFAFHTVTATASPLSATQLLNLGQRPLIVMPLLLVAGAAAIGAGMKRTAPGWPLIASYVVAAGLMALTVAKVGSYINYFLDLSAACALAAGGWVNWLRHSRTVSSVFAAFLTVQLLAMARVSDITYGALLARLSHAGDYARLESLVRRVDGPMLTDEAMALATMSGRDVDFHPFAMSQLAHAGLWDPAPFLERIRRQHYRLVLVRMPKARRDVLPTLWTPEMAGALFAHYDWQESVPVDDRAVIAVYRPSSRHGELRGSPYRDRRQLDSR